MTATRQDGGHNKKKYDRALIAGLVSGPIAYSVYFFVVYSLAEIGCKSGLAGTEIYGFSLISVAVVALTVLTALIAAGGGYLSYRGWRRSKDTPERREDAYSQFMAAAGMGLNGYFILVILATAAPVLLYVTCDSI